MGRPLISLLKWGLPEGGKVYLFVVCWWEKTGSEVKREYSLQKCKERRIHLLN